MKKTPPSAVFSLRDLNRQPAKVLDAVRKFGSAEIRTRRGEVFTVAAKSDERVSTGELPDFKSRWKKLREVGLVPPRRSDDDWVNRVIAGEE
jgi:hypothetical protein